MSTFVGSFEECQGDPAANVRGDNAGCDRLVEACEAGDLLAYNDLLYRSHFGSAYAVDGFFCRGRIPEDEPSIAMGGYFELLSQ